MKLRFTYNPITGYFTFVENNLLFKVPFSAILNKGRKLIYYSNKESSTRVRDWYEELDEVYKQQILIVANDEK